MADDTKQDVLIPGLPFKRWESNVEAWERKKREQKAQQAQANGIVSKLAAEFAAQLAVLKAAQDKAAKDAATLAVLPPAPPKKDGGGNPVVAAVNSAGNAVVGAVTQLDQLFAANPPDP